MLHIYPPKLREQIYQPKLRGPIFSFPCQSILNVLQVLLNVVLAFSFCFAFVFLFLLFLPTFHILLYFECCLAWSPSLCLTMSEAPLNSSSFRMKTQKSSENRFHLIRVSATSSFACSYYSSAVGYFLASDNF